MGIFQLIKPALKDTYASKAFHTAVSAEAAKIRAQGAFVVIEDWLIRFRGIPCLSKTPQKTPILYSLSVLFDIFWKPVRTKLLDPAVGCAMYVMVVDDKTNVPVLKAETQQERVQATRKAEAAAKVEEAQPYPLTARFHDNGILLAEDGEWVQIDLRRLRRSPHLNLLRAFYPLIKAAMEQSAVQRSFMLDYQKAGGTMFRPDGNVYEGCLPHDLGEADPALMFWAHYMGHTFGYAVHLHTSDTDVLPLWLLMADKPARVYWIDGYDQTVVDLNVLVSEIQAKARMTPARFALFCMVCGTDYMKRKHYANYFNIEEMMEAVRLADGDENHVAVFFESFLLHLYTPVWINNKPKGAVVPTSLERMRADFEASPPPKSYKFPDDDTVKEWAERLEFNCMYWKR